MLQKCGHEIVVARDGNQSWEMLQRQDAPHLVLLDWMMPGMDGVEVCSRLRALEKGVRPYVIMLTGRSQKQDLLHGFDAGADDYVTKPADPDELNARIRAGERIINLQIESLVARDALRKLATYDYLTGLRNRAAILHELQREFDSAPRLGGMVNVVMVDVDHFKTINDNYGHLFGDKVLSEVAKRMVSEVRSYESIGRYGGEEFLIVLSKCDVSAAAKVAERVRRCVATDGFCIHGERIDVTVSLGVASSCQLERPAQDLLIAMADTALYCAKNAGRNRVEVADTILPETRMRHTGYALAD
jgi:diguanylate cyclase (GGDEF)-like protein